MLRLDVPIILVAIVVLEVLVFHAFIVGARIPGGDFLGAYNAEPYAWARDGGFFNPPVWNAEELCGYPTSASIQNGLFYIPLAIVASLTTFNLHVAAVFSVAHVALGAVGVYVLARRFKLNRIAALFGLTAYFFVPVFYINAEQVDIVRAAGWTPWILLILSPHWPWRRWFAVPAAAIILWQAVVCSYPGMIVAIAYVGLIWLIGWQIIYRPNYRAYLLPVVISGLLGALLCLPKYLPMLYSRGSQGNGVDLLSPNVKDTLVSLFYWTSPADIGQAAMGSIFLPITVLAAFCLIRFRSKETRVALTVAAAGVVLALTQAPWSSLVSALPGMSLSRFRFNDFKAATMLMAVFIAMIGIDYQLQRHPREKTRPTNAIMLTLVAVGVIGALIVGARWSLPVKELVIVLITGAAAVALVIALCRVDGHKSRSIVALALVLVTMVSGYAWTDSSSERWSFDRNWLEFVNYEDTVATLIGNYQPPSTIQRPPRLPLSDDDSFFTTPVWTSPGWARSFYSGQYTVGGNVNLKGTETYDMQLDALTQVETRDQAETLFSAPGIGLSSNTFDSTGIPSVKAINSCVATGKCGTGLTVEPVSYAPGDLTYKVTASTSQAVIFNESYFPGWTASLTSQDGEVETTEPKIGVAGMTQVDIPRGAWTVELRYVQQGVTAGWLGFALSIVGQLMTILLLATSTRRRTLHARLSTMTDGQSAAPQIDQSRQKHMDGELPRDSDIRVDALKRRRHRLLGNRLDNH